MSDSLAHKILAALEHAGIGGSSIKELADEHLPAVDPETGTRAAAKPSKPAASSTPRKRGPRKPAAKKSAGSTTTSAAG